MSAIAIQTRDGTCPSYVFHPTDQGPWPGVLCFMPSRDARAQKHWKTLTALVKETIG